jgi:hypothetical protein
MTADCGHVKVTEHKSFVTADLLCMSPHPLTIKMETTPLLNLSLLTRKSPRHKQRSDLLTPWGKLQMGETIEAVSMLRK